MTAGSRRARRGVVLVAALCFFGGTAPGREAVADGRYDGGAPRRTFIVELRTGAPAAFGGQAVHAARQRLDALEVKVRRESAPAATSIYEYRTALAGFAAGLTDAEVARLRARPDVLRVTPSAPVHLTTTPGLALDPAVAPGGVVGSEAYRFLGLPDGLWARLGGADHAGDGMVVGVIDSGITPDHPSFAAAGMPPPPAGWRGLCQTGQRFSAADCNHKIVGARYFADSFRQGQALDSDELFSARDTDGHGTHTAGIAVGAAGVVPDNPFSGGAGDLGIGPLSGIAPRAHVAVYKAIWNNGSGDSADVIAAVDAAVADGVDVLSMSLGGPGRALLDPLNAALLAADEAGVATVTSAGNYGPDPSTIGSPSEAPWVTSVGATTLGRAFRAPVQVTRPGAPPLELTGASVGPGLDATPLVAGAAAGRPGVAPIDAAQCRPGTLDPDRVQGRAVLCIPGEAAPPAMGAEILARGGRGLVIVGEFRAGGFPFLDPAVNVLPDVQLTETDAFTVAQLLDDDVTVTIGRARAVPAQADELAPFSSRGPSLVAPDSLRPDLVAPGVAIVSGVSPRAGPPAVPGVTFDVYSGTSMAAPQVAGAMALLRQLHPGWSPAVLRSALMTTANANVTDPVTGGGPAGPLAAGAGRIDPNRASDPGLVFDIPPGEYLDGEGFVTPDLNLPSIAVPALVGQAVVHRTVRSVARGPATWHVAAQGLRGVSVRVTPSDFVLAPGAEQTLDISFEVDANPFEQYEVGELRFSSAELASTVHLPMAVQPLKLTFPGEIDVTTLEESGSQPFGFRSGLGGEVAAEGYGLAEPRVRFGQEVDRYTGAAIPTEAGPGVHVYDIPLRNGAAVVAAAISDADGGDPGTDLDLYILRDDESDGFTPSDIVADSATGRADEAAVVRRAPPGNYRFVVVGFATPDTGVSEYTFTTWVADDPRPDEFGPGPGIIVSGDPVVVTRGGSAVLTLEWDNVKTDATYLGLVTYRTSHGDAAGDTLVVVNRGQPGTDSRPMSFASRSSRKPL